MYLHAARKNSGEIGGATGRNPSTIRDIIARGGWKSARTGGPRKITGRTERLLIRKVQNQPKATSGELAQQMLPLVQCTPRTIGNTLRRNNTRCRVARLKPLLTANHRRCRLEFALKYYRKPAERWNRLLFSDQACSHRQKRTLVYRSPITALDSKNINQSVRHSGASALFWGCFSSRGVGPLVFINERMTAKTYINILSESLPTECCTCRAVGYSCTTMTLNTVQS